MRSKNLAAYCCSCVDDGDELKLLRIVLGHSLAMDDELERFIRERKERNAQDRACLEQDPPYMEVTVCVCVCVLPR